MICFKVICKQKDIGVGGHLIAIVADKSIQWGYDGDET